MLIILSIAAVLVISCVIFHGFTLQTIARFLFRKKEFSFYRISFLIAAAIIAHLVEIILFQISFICLIPLDHQGSIIGGGNLEWEDLFYFSAVTYTSTGYGDLTPIGNMRFLATVEALTGLIMIAWTASFAFLVMQRYWRDQDEKEKQG